MTKVTRENRRKKYSDNNENKVLRVRKYALNCCRLAFNDYP